MKRNFLTTCVLLCSCLVLISSCDFNKPDHIFTRAVEKMQAYQYKDAVTLFDIIVRAYPDSELVDRSLFFIANTYETYLLDLPKAIKTYRTILQRGPDSAYYTASIEALFRIYIAGGNKNMREMALLISRLYTNPNNKYNFAKQYILAQEYLQTKDYQQTRVIAKQIYVHAKTPLWQQRAYYLIGKSYEQQGNLAMALLTVKEMQKKYSKTIYAVPIILEIGDIFERQGNLLQAVTMYRKILNNTEKQSIYYQLTYERIERIRLRMRYTNEG